MTFYYVKFFIFKISIFSIPQYQRAYAWEKDKQLPTYLDDLRQQAFATDRNQDKSYFLGTLLLHQVDPLNNDKNIHVGFISNMFC